MEGNVARKLGQLEAKAKACLGRGEEEPSRSEQDMSINKDASMLLEDASFTGDDLLCISVKMKKDLNPYFREMLVAKRAKKAYFIYNNQIYIGREHEKLGMLYKKGR